MESRAISQFGRRLTVGVCRSGVSINTAPKDVSPVHPVSGGLGQFRMMRKNRLIRIKQS